ncbi:hypothetical protein C8R42DRAFT_729458 [Lentinula raphanica]|nr:hypothetical protein C8R42DRAFT_729458 [Lentinula raphanica]
MLRRHQVFANQRETLGSRKDILAKGFLVAKPSDNVYVAWRDQFGTGEEKDDLVKTWAMALSEHPEDLLKRMSEGRDRMYGPKEREYNGPGGIEIERMKALKPIKGAKRAYAMGVSNQSQRDLEGPASNSKRSGIMMCEGEELQREILAVVAEANVIGLSKVDSRLKEKMDRQAEMTNCPRIGSIKNKYWTSAQLNVASMNDEKEVEDGGIQLRRRHKKEGSGESARKIADIGQFGGPHLDGGDHEGIPTAMKVLTRGNQHIEAEYFTIFDLGLSWELEEFATIYFSGLHYHSGAAAVPKATFDPQEMVYTRSTLIMYPSAHEIEGDSQVALGFIPKDTMGGLLTLNKEMRDFDSHAYDTNGISAYANYIADGLGVMDDQSYLDHFSRNMLMFMLYMARQAPREGLLRIDTGRFLSSFTMRSGQERIEASPWERGPGWTGEDTRVGKKYAEDFSKLSEEELRQLWNTDSKSDTIYGNTWIATQREEWEEHRRMMMSSIPICHATGEAEQVDTNQHSSHRRIIRDSATRTARKNPERDPLAPNKKGEKRKGKGKGKEKNNKNKVNKKKEIKEKKDIKQDCEGGVIDNRGGESENKDIEERTEEKSVGEDKKTSVIKTEEEKEIPVQDVVDSAVLGVTVDSEPLGSGEQQHAPSTKFAKHLTKDVLQAELDERTFAMVQYQLEDPLPKLGESLEDLIGYYSTLSTKFSRSNLQSTILRQDLLLLRAAIWGQLGTWKAKAWEKLDRNLHLDKGKLHWFERLAWDIYSWMTVQAQDAEFHPTTYLSPTTLPIRNGDIFKLKVGRSQRNGDSVGYAVNKAEEWVVKWTGLAQMGKEGNDVLSALFIALMEQWLGPGVLSVYKVWKAAQSIVHWILEKQHGQKGTFEEVRMAVGKIQQEVNMGEIIGICTDLHNACWDVRTTEEKERFLVFTQALKSGTLTFGDYSMVQQLLPDPGSIPTPLIAESFAPDSVPSLFPNPSLSPLTPDPMDMDTENDHSVLESSEAVLSGPGTLSSSFPTQSVSLETHLDMDVDSEDNLLEWQLDDLVDQVYLCLQLTGDDLSHVATLPDPPRKSAAGREQRIFEYLSEIAQNSNQRLPFRELGESRFHVLHSNKNPYTPKNLRTTSGFFSALMVRSIHHGTQFLLDHTPFYKDYKDWEGVYEKAKEEHPDDKKYFCDPAAYGQHCGPSRDPKNAEGYWASANDQEYNQWLLNPDGFNAQENFLLSVVKVLSGKGFYGIGKLTAFQIAVDYMRAGAFEATLKEFAETLIWVDAGAVKGLVRLGYLKKKKGKQDASDVEVAFEQVLGKLRCKWDQKRGKKGASIDMIDVEHWLCKTSPKRLGRKSYYAIYK